MKLKVEYVVVALLIIGIFVATSIGKSTCPNERKCGDKICKPTQFCQVFLRSCPRPVGGLVTDSPYCPPTLECKETKCPTEKPPPKQLRCIQGYKVKMLKLPKCPYEIPTCVPENCGNNGPSIVLS